MKYSSIVGHDDTKKMLRDILRSGHAHHAFLFEGDDAAGRKGLAEAFAAALMCEAGGEEACGECHTCKQVASGNCPDLVHVVADEKKVSGKIGVDEVRRQLVDDSAVMPYACDKKVYIIADAQNMTPQAQNAMLKTLEEPPAYVVIILVSDDADTLLETVRSRCEIVPCGALSTSAIAKHLVDNGLSSKEDAVLCAALASGDLRAAEEYASSEAFEDLSFEVLAALKNISAMDIRRMHEIIDMTKDRGSADILLRIMRIWFRDVVVYKATAEIDALTLKSEHRAIMACAKNNEFIELDQAQKFIDTAQKRLDANVNQELVLELLLLNLKENIS